MDAFLEIHESDYSLLEDKIPICPEIPGERYFSRFSEGANPKIGSSP